MKTPYAICIQCMDTLQGVPTLKDSQSPVAKKHSPKTKNQTPKTNHQPPIGEYDFQIVVIKEEDPTTW